MSSKKIFLNDFDQNKLKLYVFEMDFMTNQLKLTVPNKCLKGLKHLNTVLYSRLAPGLVARTVKRNRQLGLTVLKQGI